jgi:hypothetical protein
LDLWEKHRGTELYGMDPRLDLTEQHPAAFWADHDPIGFTHQGTPTQCVEFELNRVTLCQ